jgi:alpha-glucosidase
MTTKALRTREFEFVVAPGMDGTAMGQLYVDDGVSVDQPKTTEVTMRYKEGQLTVKGKFGFRTGVKVSRVRFLGITQAPALVKLNSKAVGNSQLSYDGKTQVLDVVVGLDFVQDLSIQISYVKTCM